MPDSRNSPSDGDRHAASAQNVWSARDSYGAARDINVYQGSGGDQPLRSSGPGLFSVRPPYGRLPAEIRGRGELLDLLWEKISKEHAALSVIHGLGGCGKSTVALSLAVRARAQNREAWWVSATDPATLHNGLRQLAIDIGVEPHLVQAAWEGELSAPDLVWQRLDAHDRPWLLVIDEADDPTPLSGPNGLPTDGNGWLRQSSTGAVLVTTRDGNPDLWRRAALHPLRELQSSQAADVLLDQLRTAGIDIADSTDELKEVALRLADALGGLPLALEMAGSYLGVQCRRHLRRAGRADVVASVTAALRDYDVHVRKNVALLDRAGRRAGTNPRRPGELSEARVTATWDRSLRLLEDRGIPEARPLLQTLACYESTAFPLRALDPAVLARSPLFADGLDITQRDDALEALVDFSIVEEIVLSSEQGGVACVKVHRLVGETMATQTSGAESRVDVWSLAACLLIEAASNASEHEGTALWWTLAAPHCLRLLSRCPERTEAVPRLLTLARSAVGFLRDVGSFSSSMAIATAGYDLAVRVLGPEDRETLRCRYTYAKALTFDSRGPQATVEIRATWLMQKQLLGDEHPDTLASRSFHGSRICMEGRFAEAARYLSETADTCARVLGPDDEATLQTQSDYAIALRKLGRYRESVELHRHVLARREEALGLLDRKVTRSRNNLAFALSHWGRYREGEVQYRTNLEARRQLLGPEHPLTLVSMSNLAIHLRDMGHFDESELLCRQVIDVRSRTRGEEHTATLIPRAHLVILRVLQSRAAEVVQEAQDVMEIRHQRLGPAHPSTQTSIKTFGSVLLAVGRLAEAETHLEKVHAMRRESLGSESPYTLSSALELARLRSAQGRLSEALHLISQGASVWARSDRTGHIMACEFRFLTAALEHELGQLDRTAYAALLEMLRREMETNGLARTPLARTVRRELRCPGSRHGA